MKTYVVSSIVGVLGMVGVAQAQSAPAKAAFAKLHPQATGVKWDKEDDGYEASFKENGKTMSVVMDRKGVLKATETSMAISELPAAARNYIAKQMPGKKIKEAAIIVDANGSKMYEAEVGGKDLMFDMAGKLIK